MIDRSEMIPLLVEACTSFEPAYREFCGANEPELPCYIAIGEFARHLSTVLASGNDEVLRQVFKVVERLILEGDPYVQEAAIVGAKFSESMASVMVKDLLGYIDKAGKMLIAPQFTVACSFRDGLAMVQIGTKVGFIDKKGNFVWGPTEERLNDREPGDPCPE